eukprot:CAMPEP_0196643788 /NCGR_PEP_ID=MMETSP1085-20130531/6284_1 /TAXON_ID=41879 ORGANISM="Pycnococcus sp, Strain CCMP1998" /NCGR_SAMPLE_ID=MMETSP1085 /ASSEMBLY_ACC=CAM_ASM_000807 /LENGTH=207 /DNA_ID=CAMNT_0041973287 /DNA_START=72 /DNA_END=692 /DNA_ORIENTATION=+
MASHKPPRELRSDQDLYDLADQSKSTVLLIGSGASFQYADASRALQDTLKVLREENLYSDDEQVPAEELRKTLVFFGGDTAKDDAPDLGWLVRAVKRELGAKATVVSFQSWPETQEEFVDYVFRYEREFDEGGRELWGGTDELGGPVAATRHYLSERMQATLDCLVCVGGGTISRSELSFALRGGALRRHRYVRAEVRKKRPGCSEY